MANKIMGIFEVVNFQSDAVAETLAAAGATIEPAALYFDRHVPNVKYSVRAEYYGRGGPVPADFPADLKGTRFVRINRTWYCVGP